MQPLVIFTGMGDMYIYTHMYIYIDIYIYTYVYVYTYMYIDIVFTYCIYIDISWVETISHMYRNIDGKGQ